MEFEELKEKEGFKLHRIDMEISRKYIFTDGNTVTIIGPIGLYISNKSGSHRVVCKDGRVFYVSPDFKAIMWNYKEEFIKEKQFDF